MRTTGRLRAVLEDLKTVAFEDRRDALDRQLRLLAGAVERELDDDEDVQAALVADTQGIGSGADVASRYAAPIIRR